MNTVVLNGFGPHVRLTTTSPDAGMVRVVTRTQVRRVPLRKTTDLKFRRA